MKSLIKIALTLFLFFTGMLILFKFTGILTLEKIEIWMEAAKNTNPIFVALIVAGLLFCDLFMAVPTLSIMLLAGYFLGPVYAFIAAIIGVLAAGLCGYFLSRRYGDKLLNSLISDPSEREEAVQTFQKHGPIIILLSRATPVLPEVSACLAGITKMSFYRFLLLWLLSSVPYALIATYAGSVSSIQDPKPAIFAAIGLTTFFFMAWMLFKRINSEKLSGI